ncbi:MAG: hypothetical protein ACTSYS_13815 [Promethearchaeota archaeon]
MNMTNFEKLAPLSKIYIPFRSSFFKELLRVSESQFNIEDAKNHVIVFLLASLKARPFVEKSELKKIFTTIASAIKSCNSKQELRDTILNAKIITLELPVSNFGSFDELVTKFLEG